MESMCLKLNHIQTAITYPLRSSIIVANAGSDKLNHITFSTINRKTIVRRSLNIQPRSGFSVIRAEAAAGSYEFSERDDGEKKMVIKSESKLSDAGSNTKGFMASQAGGSDTGNGGHSHGGNNGGGGDSNNNNSDDGHEDSGHGKLINTICWLILLYIRVLRMTSTKWGNDTPHDLAWFGVVVFEFVAVSVMFLIDFTEPFMTPSVDAGSEVMATLFSGLMWFLTEVECSLRVFMSMMLAGFAAVQDWCHL